jgi:hypothetical protein
MTVHLPPELVKSYLSPEQVEALVPGMTKGKLAQLRFTGKGPRYRKPTPKTVLYTEAEVIQWIEDSARYGTAVEAV